MKVKIPSGTTPKIIYSGIRERVILNEFRKKQNDFSIDFLSKVEGFDTWDAFITSGSTPYLVEIKVRNFPIDQNFNPEENGWVIQKNKYNELMRILSTSLSEEKETECYYMNVCLDGVILFKPEELEFNWKWRPMKKSTMKNTKPIFKEVDYIPTEKGTIYRINFDWKSITKQCNDIWEFFFPGIEIPTL